MIIYLDNNFNPVDKDQAVMAKVIPDNGEPPYFVSVEREQDDKDTRPNPA